MRLSAQVPKPSSLIHESTSFLEAEGLERTWKFTQEEIQQHVDLNTSKKKFSLKLDDFGPYTMDYTRNGRSVMLENCQRKL